MKSLNFNIKIFADGADEKEMFRLYESDLIKGLTTNPTLMRQANISDYEKFARGILMKIKINLFRLKYLLTILMKWKDRQSKYLRSRKCICKNTNNKYKRAIIA